MLLAVEKREISRRQSYTFEHMPLIPLPDVMIVQSSAYEAKETPSAGCGSFEK